VRDHNAACRLPELAMLSVLAHPELEIAEAAIGALALLPEDRARLYLDVIMTVLPEAIRQILEARMQHYEYQSDFARKYYGQGREEGREEGRQEGREEGREEGRQEGREAGRHEGLRAAVIMLARNKLEELSKIDIAAIEAMSDLPALAELVTWLGQAVGAAEARVALDRALRAYHREIP
jgi:predicted transposase YdaD